MTPSRLRHWALSLSSFIVEHHVNSQWQKGNRWHQISPRLVLGPSESIWAQRLMVLRRGPKTERLPQAVAQIFDEVWICVFWDKHADWQTVPVPGTFVSVNRRNNEALAHIYLWIYGNFLQCRFWRCMQSSRTLRYTLEHACCIMPSMFPAEFCT